MNESAALPNDPALWLAELPKPHEGSNKYTRGHALVFGGYPITGAARLAARASARSGAGLTTIAVPELAFPVYAAALTSIMVRPLSDPADFRNLLEDHRFSAILIGPGGGVGEETRARVLSLLHSRRPVVLDADALTTFAGNPNTLFKAVAGDCVMTPHDGEFQRLFDARGDKLTRARQAARQSGAVLILKGSNTVIAAPDGRAILNSNAPATLATAGSGDGSVAAWGSRHELRPRLDCGRSAGVAAWGIPASLWSPRTQRLGTSAQCGLPYRD